MISILLLKKIAELFVMIFMGYALVRCKQMTVEDSRPLSVVSLYLLNPCVIISSFQIQRTPELMNSLALSLAGALLILSSFVIIGTLLRRPLHMSRVEQASITYSNCANLLIPIIASILGPEWVIFANVFYVVQMFLFWTHCKTLISGERSISLRKLFLNPNIIACFVGGSLFLANIRLPAIVGNAVSTIGGMLGPVGMLITGMLMAGVDLKKIIRDPGVWRASFLRLIALPLVILVIFKYSGMAGLSPSGQSVLLISLLAACAPSASTVTQLAQVYAGDRAGEYAGAINVLSTLLCIATMPLIVWLYML